MADQLVGAARAALGQGLAMGWGDEAEGWLRSKLGQGSYEDMVAKVRGEYAEYSKESPFVSGAAEFAGGVLPGVGLMLVPGAQVAGGAQIAKSGGLALAKLAALGGATGVVSGAGSAEEGKRGSGAVTGGVVGTALGGTIPLAIKGGGATFKWLRERLNPSDSYVTNRAADKMSGATAQTDTTPQQIEKAMANDRAMKVPSVIANTSPALSDLAEAVAQRTGRGARKIEDTLQQQRLGARERTHQQVTKGLKPGNFYDDEQRMISDLRSNAKTVYDDAYAVGTIDDPTINSVLSNPAFKGFFDKAKTIANTEAQAAKLRGEDPGKYQLQDIYKLVKGADGNMTMESSKAPDVRTLDYIKRGIDATIDAGFRGQGMSTAEASALRQLRTEFVKRIDDLVPEYKVARKTYAGDMEVLDSMRKGMAKFGSMDHEQVIKLVAGMSNAEKEAFRTGVSRDLYTKIMNPSGNFNAAQRIIGSPETQAKLQPLFDNPGHFDLFKTAMEREAQLFNQSNRILGGSQTGKRMQMREELEGGGGVGEAIGQAITGGFWSGLTGLASRAIRSGGMTEDISAKLSTMLMSKDPHEVAAVVKILEQHAAKAAPKAFRAGALERGAVTGTASTIWPAPMVKGEASNIDDAQSTPGLPLGPGLDDEVK